MEVDIKTKTIILTKEHIVGDYWRGSIFNTKYCNVNAATKRIIQRDIDKGYKVVYKSGKKKILMLYNK